MIYWFSFIALELLRNYVLIEKRKTKPDYLDSFVLRSFFGLVGIPIMHPEFDPLGDYTTIWQAIPIVCFEVSSFYLLFDPILNKLRGKPALYRGKASGYLDSLGLPYYITLKVFTLIILILCLFVFWGTPQWDWLISLRTFFLLS